MPNIIPVPVTVSLGVTAASKEDRGNVRNFGAFSLVPYASTRSGSLDIDRWLLLKSGEVSELDETGLFSVMPKKLLWHVCQQTFESEVDAIPMVITIDDEQWTFPMCARELEYEQVHYMIEIEGEWLRITEVALSDLISEEQFAFCAREVLPTIDFADPSAVFDEMG
jgi:hypothetical protein